MGFKRYTLEDGKMTATLNGLWCKVDEVNALLNLGAEYEALFERLQKLGAVRVEDLVKEYELKEEHARLQHPRVEPTEYTRNFLNVAPGEQTKGFYVEQVTPDKLCLQINGDVHFWIKYFNTDKILPQGYINIDRRLRITNIMAPRTGNDAD